MSSKPSEESKGASDDTTRKPMPFEPTASKPKRSITGTKPPVGPQVGRSRQSGIPEAVSRRMIKRMAFFSGIPSALGMSTFVISYIIVSQHLFDLPTYAVLLVSLGFFGLGVLGLSYGALSASWEEDSEGSTLGVEQFQLNWGRMTEAWRENSEKAKSGKS
jgi:hypothetical protein